MSAVVYMTSTGAFDCLEEVFRPGVGTAGGKQQLNKH